MKKRIRQQALAFLFTCLNNNNYFKTVYVQMVDLK